MDVFIEKIVQKKKDLKDIALSVLIWIAAVIISFIAIMFLSSFGVLIAGGAMYGAWYLTTSFSLEFEYILTNGEIDVDKIIARRKRKRIITVNSRQFEIFAPYIQKYQNEYNSQTIKEKIYALSSIDSPDAYFAIFDHKETGKTLLVFEPDERMINNFKTLNPRRVFER